MAREISGREGDPGLSLAPYRSGEGDARRAAGQCIRAPKTSPSSLVGQTRQAAEGLDDRRRAARAFEGFLLGELLKIMRTPEESRVGLWSPSRGEIIFIRQQCEALGDLLAQREPLGLWRPLWGVRSEASCWRQATADEQGHSKGGSQDAHPK